LRSGANRSIPLCRATSSALAVVSRGKGECYAHAMQAPSLPVRPLKRVEYEILAAAGVFERERVELIHGAILHMSAIGPMHSSDAEPVGGEYQKTRVARPGETLTLIAFPDVTVRVDDVLP